MSDIALQLTADGSYTFDRGAGKESYHSRFGAVTEAKEVFLRNSGVKQRLNQRLPTSVLEIGFGSGLNFILSSQCARQNTTNLCYTSYEVQIPNPALIAELLGRNTQGCEDDINALLSLLASTPKQTPFTINNVTELSLLLDDALCAELPTSQFHAVYLDTFSYKEMPEFWQTRFLKKLHNALKPLGRLATYGVNRPFKDALSEAGFEWQKKPGPRGKREVIVATKPFYCP